MTFLIQVYLVQKKNDNKYFAIKILKKKDIIEKDQLEHTKTEKMILEHVIFLKPIILGESSIFSYTVLFIFNS